MSDDARPLIDNPYRASSTPIYAGDVNVTDLMARAWERGFAAGQSQAWDSAQAEIDAIRAAGRAAAPDDDDGPFREDLPAILQSVRDGQGTGHYEHPVVPLHIALAAVTRAEAAGRAAATPPLHGTGYCPQPCPECAAATPDPPDGFRVTVYSGQSATDERPAAVSTRYAGATDLHDVLRRIGLEWKQADYMGQRQVVVTVDPVAHAASPDERLREALAEIVRQVEKYPALSPTGIMVRDDIAGMVEGAARAALAAAARDTPDDSPDLGCPDGGTCHHNCGDYAGPPFHCWRVHNAAPLSMYGEAWPTPLPHAVVLPVNEPETNT